MPPITSLFNIFYVVVLDMAHMQLSGGKVSNHFTLCKAEQGHLSGLEIKHLT